MTPKEKAKQIHDDMYKIISRGRANRDTYIGTEYINDLWETAKECALETVFEMLKLLRDLGYDDEDHRIIYQKEVKQEIESL
jgi:hypothetical protein